MKYFIEGYQDKWDNIAPVMIEIPNDTINLTMYLYPIIYNDFPIQASVSYDSNKRRYFTDVNPLREINGPLSEWGESLEPPISDEWDAFIDDCKFLINELGFTIISSKRSDSSKKSEYVITYGLDDTPCGTIVYDLRLSDHPFDKTFPEYVKDEALEYLKINKILDGTATKAGIDFQVEQVLVGNVSCDSWNKAFHRLYLLLKKMRKRVRFRLDNKS